MLIEVSESTQVGEARRHAVALAEEWEMGEPRSGAIALATTEMATNLVKHVGRGHILVQHLHEDSNHGVRLISVDKGPGIANVAQALADGHSTAGSMGAGLGAIKRLCDGFDIYTVPGSGTVISAEFWQTKRRRHASMDFAVVSEPIRGEEVCGDGWGAYANSEEMVLMVADGLGHGVLAAEAAREAELVLARAHAAPLSEIVHDMHAALKKTRGAALGIAKIDISRSLMFFAGVGNTSAVLVAPGSSRSLVSHNGTVGQSMQRLQEFSCPWNPGIILVMHSDGLGTRWDLERYPGIWTKSPSLIAAVLHRDFSRGRDDVTVLVAKAA